MEIKRVGSQPSAKGPSEWFTGTVRIDPLFQAPDPAFVQGAPHRLAGDGEGEGADEGAHRRQVGQGAARVFRRPGAIERGPR